MSGVESSEHEESGSNSFLDVITNFVGILIVLVMVVGMNAQRATQAILSRPPDPELQAARAEANTIEQDVHHIAAQMATVQGEMSARFNERNTLNTIVAALQRRIDDRRATLDAEAQKDFDLKNALAAAQAQVEKLKAERDATEKYAAHQEIKIESFPTPLSKTVDGHEAHFQLSGGRIVFVPFDTLKDRLVSSMREYAWKMQEQGDLTDTIGPIGGFRMRYTIERHDSPRGSFLQVAYVEFLPASNQLGEPMDEALSARSKFRDKLEMMSPRQYTITVWTYPDSFAEFRKLKKELYHLGYNVAARPLPEGMPIGASPSGSKSSAQ